MPSPSRIRGRSSGEDLIRRGDGDDRDPDSTVVSFDESQRDQDVQAALHFSRARSRTVDQSDLGTEIGGGGVGAGTSGSGGDGIGLSPEDKDRRREAAQKQMEQDVRFFSPEGLHPSSPSGPHHHHHHRSSGAGGDSPPSRPMALGRDSAGRPPTMHHQAAQARLYRHHRNLSDASLDSSHGAFIDHRQQSHSLGSPHPVTVVPSRSPGQRTAGGGRSALREELLRGGNRQSDLLTGDEDDFALSDPVLPVSSPRSPGQTDPDRPSNLSLSRPDSPSNPTSPRMSASVATARPAQHFDSSGLQGSAIMDDPDDFDDMLDHRPPQDAESSAGHHRLSAHLSPTMRPSAGARHYSRSSVAAGGGANRGNRLEGDVASMLTASRRPSQAEEDVCFPMLQGAGPDRLDLGVPLEGRGIPGILPNFPFPFDFSALEEYADKERETWSLGSGGEGAERQGRPTAVSAAGDVEGIRRRTNLGTSPKSPTFALPATDSFSPTEGGPHGPEKKGRIGMLKQRRLSESVGPRHGRQRKLALFENSGGSDHPNANGDLTPSRTKTIPTSSADAKAPLLGGKFQRGYSSASANHQGHGGGGKPHSHVDRPYRFSFYSNALPSTIHARSLAEIPADGQTFEELFTGRSPSAEGWDSGTERTGAGSGANTGAMGTPLHKGSELNGAKRGSGQNGITGGGTSTTAASREGMTAAQAMSNLGAGGAGQQGGPGLGGVGGGKRHHGHHHGHGKQKSTVLMRSDEDAEENTWWLDVLCPTDHEMKVLSKVFGIHPLTTEDIQMEETREKIELFRNYYLVCFRSFDQDPYSPTYLEPLNMYIIVFREGTLSFHFRGTPHPQNVRRRIKQLKDYINVTSDWISYALIDDITDAFGPLIQSIEYEVDSIDELVLILKDAEQSDMLRRIGMCRKKVMGLLRLMGNKADVVKGLAKRCNENWSVAPKSDIGLYLSDIQDHLVTMTQNLNHYEKILSRSHSNYLASISIDMTEANNQINDVLSKLTALGSILVPMNLVTGLWGMNVHVPGQDVQTGYTWFVSIVAALVTFGVLGAYATLKYFSNGGGYKKRR